MKKLILAILLGIIIIPGLLYILLPRPAFCEGLYGPNVWLTFWGSYLGGILTALVGFVTIYRSEKRQNLQIEIAHKQKTLAILEERISKAVSALELTKLSAICFYIYPKSNNFSETDNNITVLQHLDLYKIYDTLLDELIERTKTAKEFSVIYYDPNTEVTTPKGIFLLHFNEVYKDFEERFIHIQVLTRELISGLIAIKYHGENIEAIAEKISRINEEIKFITSKYNVNTDIYESLHKYAVNWLMAENKEIQKLKDKLE